jgi:hypothetical protein
MKRRSVLVMLGGAAGAIATPTMPASAWTAGTVTSGSVETGNAALYWSAVAESVIPTGRPPGSAGVLGGIVHAAIHDAAMAVSGRGRGFLVSPPVRGPASISAAVATAAYLVLAARLPSYADALAGEYAGFLAPIPTGTVKQRGIEAGRAVAEAIITARADDGLDAIVPWQQPPVGPGVFEPVATNPDGTPATPVDVKLSRVVPLLMASRDQFRPPGPDPLTSSDYAADIDEVAAYGRADSAVRSAAQTETARFWAENAFVQWSRTLRHLAASRRLGTPAAARMLGLAHVAAADAIIGCFDAKYHFLFWRPVHAIARADTDGNPATTPDPTWLPLLTVNHPEYPSAHACWSYAVAGALLGFFRTDRIPLTMTSTVTGTSRTYPRLTDTAREVLDARVWAGLHFRNSMRDGARLGRRVADLVGRTPR